LYFAFLDAEQQRIDEDLQRLHQTVNAMETRYEKIMRVEKKRLKIKAKKARVHEANRLGTAQSIEKAAKNLINELKRTRDDLDLQGTIRIY
jgi:hypothetical protein